MIEKLYLSVQIQTTGLFLCQYRYFDVFNQLLQQDQEVLAAHRKVCKYYALSDEYNASQHRVHITQICNNVGQGLLVTEFVSLPVVYFLDYVLGCLSRSC